MRAYFLYERVHILLTDRKHLHDLIILLRGGRVSVHKTSLIPPLFIEMPVPNQESEQSWLCMCVLGVSIVSLSIIFLLELLRQFGLFCFYFCYFSSLKMELVNRQVLLERFTKYQHWWLYPPSYGNPLVKKASHEQQHVIINYCNTNKYISKGKIISIIFTYKMMMRDGFWFKVDHCCTIMFSNGLMYHHSILTFLDV